MSKLSWWRVICLLLMFCGLATVASPAATFTTLVNFNGTDGSFPLADLVQGFNGDLYGTTALDGTHKAGTVFKISLGGRLTTLHGFNSTDGSNPEAGLVQATNGNFYGTTTNGGAYDLGTVFEITAGGRLTTIHSFNATDGSGPMAKLVQATNGDFYGTTYFGGTDTICDGGAGCGTVFEITPTGKLTTLHSFCSEPGCADGHFPDAGLIQASNGNFYGTTVGGPGTTGNCPPGCGTVFEITSTGKLTTLYSFCSQPNCADGAESAGALIQAANGNFYGTTLSGGTYGTGTVFEITPAGSLTTLHSFRFARTPFPGLVQATNGGFWGTTSEGGHYGRGTVFGMSEAGKATTIYSLGSQPDDGQDPQAGLVQATDGNFYGTTLGGVDGSGTVFRLAVGLRPFVEILPTSGNVGAAITILGNNLTGATSVTFNGTAAPFTVISSFEIKTNVPNGSTTGQVKVTTPSRILTSNLNFRVT